MNLKACRKKPSTPTQPLLFLSFSFLATRRVFAHTCQCHLVDGGGLPVICSQYYVFYVFVLEGREGQDGPPLPLKAADLHMRFVADLRHHHHLSHVPPVPQLGLRREEDVERGRLDGLHHQTCRLGGMRETCPGAWSERGNDSQLVAHHSRQWRERREGAIHKSLLENFSRTTCTALTPLNSSFGVQDKDMIL